MKAAVLRETKQPLTLEEVSIDDPKPGEVLVRTGATGVCHSDLHYMLGAYPHPLPTILGHESAGTVDQVGEGVETVKAGDRVVLSFVPSCGNCERCVEGRPVLCLRTRRGERPDKLTQGETSINQFAGMSAFAEMQLVQESACIPLPDGVPVESACLVGCSVMTGFGAVVNTAQMEPGSTVAVIGLGGVGLNIVQSAALAGASRIFAVDIAEDKLQAARQFGATDTIDASQDDPIDSLKKATKRITGGGVDYAFEAIGLAKTAEQAFAMARRGGAAVIVGMVPVGEKISVPAAQFLTEKRILGSFYGSARQAKDMPKLLQLYQQGKIKIDEMITNRYALDQINEAYDDLQKGAMLRGVLTFDN